MITVTLNNTQYQCPTSWDDITYSKFVDFINIENISTEQLIELFVGIDIEIINNTSVNSVEKLVMLLSFVYEDEWMNYVKCPEGYDEFKFGNLTYGEVEVIRGKMASKKGFEAMLDVYQLITKQDISQKPCTEVVPQVNFFLNSYIHFSIFTPNLVKELQPLKSNRQELIGSISSGHLQL